MTTPKRNELSPKYTIKYDEEMASWEAVSIIIQSLTGAVDIDLRDEIIVGCLKHITGDEVIYEKYGRGFTITTKKNK